MIYKENVWYYKRVRIRHKGLMFSILLISISLFLALLAVQRKNPVISPKTSVVENEYGFELDGKFYKINPNEIESGCLGKDCIPSIDNPIFESANEADSWLDAEDRVFAIDFNGIQKAYPQRIMNWHEIVNDDFDSTPIAVTFCPLCGTAISFIRVVDGEPTEFGVSGKLHNSDLIMYDRNSDNYWQQLTGEAIVGEAARRGLVLEQIPTTTTTWEAWKSEYPSTKVLSRETGFKRNYNQYPYGAYEEDDSIFFGVKNSNLSLHPKEVVYGVTINGLSKAYKESDLRTNNKVLDDVGGVNISIEVEPSGNVIVSNLDSGEKIIPIRGFWFAWAAFHPDTKLYSVTE